ncbi:9735_t:CDS:1, partial [Gigaspora rosea]
RFSLGKWGTSSWPGKLLSKEHTWLEWQMNVAAKMASEDSMDPMSELFGGKRERARMAAQLSPKSKLPKVASSMYGQPSSTYFPMCGPPQP